MEKYRVVEKQDFVGELCFIPQYRKFWLWMSFYELECFPKLIKFYSLASAKDFILKQKNSPKTKIHYFN